MIRNKNLYTLLAAVLISVLYPTSVQAQNGTHRFRDHGVAAPVSSHRGTVATVDGNGRNVVLIWLFDHRGGYALLMVDAETGRSEEFPVPFVPNKDVPYASLLSTGNKYYTLFNGNFLEFDPVRRGFTFHQTTLPQMAMGMTEDDHGTIWAVTYPNSGVVSFDPVSRKMKDHGYVYKQNWRQYQRFVSADDAGWIYFALGNTATQIVAFDPRTGEAMPMLEDDERKTGMAFVYRDTNGKVYGQALQSEDEPWYEFHKGTRRKIGKHDQRSPKQIITGSQSLFHQLFPDGSTLESSDLLDRTMTVNNPATNVSRKVAFDYSSEGAWVMGVAVSPDGMVCGGTTFPMRFFRYDPSAEKWDHQPAHGQYNALTSDAGSFFFGVYPGGYMLEWDTSKEWTGTDRKIPGANPRFLAAASPYVYRPHRVLAHTDNRTLVMGGTPQYGYTGGGLLFWDRLNNSATVLEDSHVIPDQSTMSFVSLNNGLILGGTTTTPGSGGEKKASESELYTISPESKKVVWRQVVIPGVQEYSDLCKGPKDLVYGIANKRVFFVFDVRKKSIIHTEDAAARFGITTGEQSPRIFVRTDHGVYLLFKKGIAHLDEKSFTLTMVAEAPVDIDAGGAFLDGRIYFVSGSHIWSYELGR